MMEETVTEETGAENVHWQLDDLYSSQQELNDDMEQVKENADAFSSRYRNRTLELNADELRQALVEFQELNDRMDRAFTYVYLNWCTNTEDPARGALLQQVRERFNEIEQILLFFELELIRLPDERYQSFKESDSLSDFRHYLEVLRLHREHVLTEAEEKILSTKAITGEEAWSRFFDELLGATRFRLRGQEVTEQQILSKLHDPSRDLRRDAASGFTEGLQRYLRPLTFIFNTLLADKASSDRLRNFSHWLSARNLSNQISDEAVETLISSVTNRYELVARFYRLKKRLLGYEEMFDYDRYAPIEGLEGTYVWDDARRLVLDSYDAFHPTMGEIARKFFEHTWIDAAPTPGKRGGAFSHRAVPQVHPFILMNFTGRIRDVQTLAHELGHGVHQYLARKQGSLQARTPLTTSEMASVFGEMLVFERLMQQESNPRIQLGLLISKIDDTMATVFRQIAMNRFEDRIHEARRSTGELSPEKFSEHWIETQEAMFQGNVTLTDHYQIWWSYIPHFLHTPGYVYAYAFGELLVLALYEHYRAGADSFAEKYLKLLEAGGNNWPDQLVGQLGIDLQDPGFWNEGLLVIENLIERAEALAEELDS